MAYAQWIRVRVHPRNCTVQVKNARLDWGKFHAEGNKDKDMSPDQVNSITVSAGNQAYIHSCGRAESASGTEGRFDLYDGDTHIGTFYWDCPWGSKYSTIKWETHDNNRYHSDASGGNLNGGAIGGVDIDIVKL